MSLSRTRTSILTLSLMGLTSFAPALVQAQGLTTAPVQSSQQGKQVGFDGVVEAVRQTMVAAQVPGAITAIDVKTGDHVKAGQVLLRIDAQAANQNASASEAQVQAAKAQLNVATKEVERQRQLYQKQYISQSALDRAEAQYQATQAQVKAQLAQAGAARTQSGYFVIKAPYDGVVADVPVVLGDMAMPGRPLMTVYDPKAMRVTAAVPQSAAPLAVSTDGAKVELPAGTQGGAVWLTPSRIQVLPTVDPATHTVQVRMDLAAGTQGVTPGMFARAWLPAQGQEAQPARLYVPAKAVFKRAEVSAVYVVNSDGKPMMRQVRTGSQSGGLVEILSGVSAGERVATEPQAAARSR